MTDRDATDAVRPAGHPPTQTVPDRLDKIGTSLREAFDADAAEPLPQAFEELLRQLR